jgi:hypothetical protein
LLSNSSSPAPVAQAPVSTPPPPSGSSIPAISVQATPVHTRLSGSARNPFGAAAGAAKVSSPSTTATSTAVTAVGNAAQGAVNALGGSGGLGSSVGSSSSSTATGTTSTSSGSGTSNPPSITGNAKPKPVHPGLSSTQAYDVALSITTSSGGVDTIDPLTRLTVLPSNDQPRVVELGVLKGGSRVVFALLPGTKVTGPGTCVPGPIYCEILELGQDQTESISTQTPHGYSQVALFAVTGISVNKYSSAAAATKAREQESAVGRTDLSQASLPTLSFFQYEPSTGSIVDLRNLTVGG